jgi:molybdate transport system regulatory protein
MPQQREKIFQPRLRILLGREIALGPGKAELLRGIDRRGSIALAAQDLGLSYMRAWTMLKTMKNCFRRPLVQVVRGGKKGGGARLTAEGKNILRLYDKMETQSHRATHASWQNLRRHLRG